MSTANRLVLKREIQLKISFIYDTFHTCNSHKVITTSENKFDDAQIIRQIVINSSEIP